MANVEMNTGMNDWESIRPTSSILISCFLRMTHRVFKQFGTDPTTLNQAGPSSTSSLWGNLNDC